MATLTNTKIKDTYDGLLKTNDNGVLGGTSKEITDGLGNGSGIYIGTNERLGVGTNSPSQKISIAGSGGSLSNVASISLWDNNSNASRRWAIANGASAAGIDQIGALTFSVATGSSSADPITSGSEKMRITSAGDVQLVGNKYLYANPSAGSTTIGAGFKLDGVNNIMGLWTNDTESMRIDSSGNVGIGVDPSAKLSVLEPTANSEYASMGSGSTVSRHLKFSGFVANGTNNVGHRLSAPNAIALNVNSSDRLYIDNSGKVGIGTAPTKLFEIAGDSEVEVPTIRIKDTDLGNTYLQTIGTLDFYSSDLDGDHIGAFMSCYSDEVFGRKNGLIFGVSQSVSADATEAMRLDSRGNLGINTDNPAVKLEIFGSGNTLRLDSDANQSKEILFRNVGSGTAVIKTDGDLRLDAEDAGKTIQFNTAGSEAMRIDSSGNVGIGTDNASAKLTVFSSGGYSVSSSGKADNGIDIQGTAGGNGNYASGVSFGVGGVGRAAISAVQNSADTDVVGLAFFTHGSSTGSGDAAEAMRITSGGLVNIGDNTSSGVGRVNISANPSNNYQIEFFTSAGTPVGSITTSGGTTTNYNTSSDYRLKEDWQPIAGALDRVEALKPINFAWKTDGNRVDGFLAHELQEVVPEAVTGEKDATEEYEITPAVLDEEGNVIEEAVMGTRDVYQGIDQSKIVPLLVAAIQELKAEIELLKN